MKVIHIITSLDNGGAEATLFRLVTSDKNRSHEVISLMEDGIYGNKLRRAGIRVYALGMSRGRISIMTIFKIYKIVRESQPDIVQTWLYHADLLGGVVARMAGIQAVVWGIRSPFDKGITSLRTRSVVKACALLSRWMPRIIVCNSEFAINSHVQAGYAKDKMVLIRNGYPLNVFRPDPSARKAVCQEYGIAEDVSIIGMVARFDEHKDHRNLLAALALLSQRGIPFVCLLVGEDMVDTNLVLARLVEEHRLEDAIRRVGPREDINRVMAALDIHVLSSAAESFPNVIAEAMACGTPCVTTDVGDASALVGDSGWVVPRSNPTELANGIQKALEEKSDEAAWGRRRAQVRVRVVENYSVQRMVTDYEKAWANVA